MAAHARLGPSSAHRWARCPASIRLSEHLPEARPGVAAAVGTLMHTVFERQLLNQSHLHEPEIEFLLECGVPEVRARQIIDQGVRAARRVLSQFQITEYLTETRVDPGQAIGRTDFWGTADLIGAEPKNRTLLVGDLKTGRGRVDVVANDQLLSYAVGALALVNFKPTRIVLAIFQPPLLGDVPAVWETDAHTLDQFCKFIKKRAALTDVDDHPPQPSEEACLWCPAKQVCPAVATLCHDQPTVS